MLLFSFLSSDFSHGVLEWTFITSFLCLKILKRGVSRIKWHFFFHGKCLAQWLTNILIILANVNNSDLPRHFIACTHLMKSKHLSHPSHSSVPYGLGSTWCEPGCPSSHWFPVCPSSHLSLRSGWEDLPCVRSHCQWFTLHSLQHSISINPPFQSQLPIFVSIPTPNSQLESRNWTVSPLHLQYRSECLDK